MAAGSCFQNVNQNLKLHFYENLRPTGSPPPPFHEVILLIVNNQNCHFLKANQDWTFFLTSFQPRLLIAVGHWMSLFKELKVVSVPARWEC